MRTVIGFLLLAACSTPEEPPSVEVLIVMPGQWTDCDHGCSERMGASLYAIDRKPVSQKHLSACVRAGVCKDVGLESSDPATLDRERAEQYCAWRGARLPTEFERKQARLAVPRWTDGGGSAGGLEWTSRDCVRIDVSGGIAKVDEEWCDAGTWVRCARTIP